MCPVNGLRQYVGFHGWLLSACSTTTFELGWWCYFLGSKPDTPCLLAQKLQPVLGPEKRAKPWAAMCVSGMGIELWSFCRQVTLLALSAWGCAVILLLLELLLLPRVFQVALQMSSLILSFLLSLVWSVTKHLHFFFLLNWFLFSAFPLLIATILGQTLDLRFVSRWL